jgi:hypothetical protein
VSRRKRREERSMSTPLRFVVASCTCAALAAAAATSAQELDARHFSPAPLGTSFVIAGVGESEGAIVFDPSLDIENVHADLDIVTTGFGRVFALGERQARVLFVMTHAAGTIGAAVGSAPQAAELHGFVDPRIKLSIGLRGAPALAPQDFARAPRGTVVSAAVTLVPPWGDYEPTSLVNLGYNRWALKPEIGVLRAFGRWTVEGVLGAWLYSRNDEQFPGTAHKRQEPLLSAQAHVSYTWPSRVWLALDATSFAGGDSRVDGVENPDYQENSRLGVTLSLPFGTRNSLKLTYSEGATTRRGNDFDSLVLTWQHVKL